MQIQIPARILGLNCALTRDVLVEMAQDYAKFAFGEAGSINGPTLLADAPGAASRLRESGDDHVVEDRLMCVMMVPQEFYNSDKLAENMRGLLSTISATCYAVITEAWEATYKPDDHEVMKLTPSQREDKREIVTIFVHHTDGRLMMRAVIERDAEGNATLGEFETIEADDVSGRFTTWLDAEAA